MHHIMDCQQLPSLSTFLSSCLVQLVIPAPSQVLLLSLLSLSLQSSFIFLSPSSSIHHQRHYYYLFYRGPAERICVGLQSYSMENLNGKQWASIN